MTRQEQYHEQVTSWLARNFPEVMDGELPHPAAFMAVVRLHHQFGKGTVTRGEHGELIRRAVKRFDERLSRAQQRSES